MENLKNMNLFDELKSKDDDVNIEFTNEVEIEDYVKQNDTKVSSNTNLKTELEDNEFDWDDI